MNKYKIVAYDPNPKRCGVYEAIVENGEITSDNNIQCFFEEALSDMSVDEMCQYDFIDYDYIDDDGTVYGGTVHIIQIS